MEYELEGIHLAERMEVGYYLYSPEFEQDPDMPECNVVSIAGRGEHLLDRTEVRQLIEWLEKWEKLYA